MSANGVPTDYLKELFGNGPVSCGAVIDQDTFAATKDGLRLGATAKDTVSAIHATLCRVVSPAIAAICAAGAGLLQSRDCLLDENAISTAEPVWVTAANKGGADRAAVAFTAESIADATLAALRFIVAAKVNYWKTNHHTGSPKPAGYFLKALKLSKLDDASEADISALWRLVHWADTRVILAVLGISGLKVDKASVAAARKVIRPSDDVVLRIRSAPAGTAKWADVWAGIKTIEGSAPYAMVGPMMGIARADAAAINDRICAGDPVYHMGAGYLCGKNRVILEEWAPLVVSWVRTCLEDFDSQSSLLRAAVFMHVEPTASITRQIKKIAEMSIEAMKEAPLGLTWNEAKAQAGASARGATTKTAAKEEIDVDGADSDGDDDDDDAGTDGDEVV